MAEKDATVRLRRAVKENNLFIVKRLIQRTDMRNPDPAPRRYTSLAWASVLGHEETFEFLMNAGHDDAELSKDSENNTILMLLADHTPSAPMQSRSNNVDANVDVMGAALRMARMYYDRFPDILDWSNVHGKTALHISALKGHEELVRMLCDCGADVDLSDNKGNTPLHYASSWGHTPIVQLLIERGCAYTAKNNEGFTASDYAYSFTTKDTLQDTARLQFENNKKSRRNVFAQAAARGSEWGGFTSVPPPVPSKGRDIRLSPSRLRSGSGTSRTTATSDSGEVDSNGLAPAHRSQSSSSSPSTAPHPFLSPHGPPSSNGYSASSPSKMRGSSPFSSNSAVSPVASRMRQQDANARQKFMHDSGMNRDRSGSQGTASTDNKSQNGDMHFPSSATSVDGDHVSSLTRLGGASGSVTPRRLRPSMSAAQLRTNPESLNIVTSFSENRTRAGTNPTAPRPTLPELGRSSSISSSTLPRSMSSIADQSAFEESENYTGPPSQYAQFPEPPLRAPDDSSTPTAGRRLPFHLLSKPLPSTDPPNHRRGMSATSVRSP
ncbi:ankyrin repeat-containing domain protein [Mycena pura]|uniref:Ankyrin repeat-containing domain protein n=1 Tax=Mycena pura TaxID=153505 RepID=A0AAD6YT35_9AGAR|nr:ankyrin repeat-containing domain protein [Mycena pura]